MIIKSHIFIVLRETNHLLKNIIMGTFILIKENGDERRISARIIEGIAFRPDGKTPYMNVSAMKQDGISDKSVLKAIKNGSIAKNVSMMACAITLGLGRNGYELLSYEEFKELKMSQLETRLMCRQEELRFIESEYGLGLYCTQRIPKSIFNIIRPFGRYERADDGTMEFIDDQYPHATPMRSEVRGWYYTERAILELREIGIKVTVKQQQDNYYL